MTTYTIAFSPDFDELEWVIPSKGWTGPIDVVAGSRRMQFMFYDLARLTQDAQHEIGSDGMFAEPNLVIVETVTREAIEAAVARMATYDFRGFAVVEGGPGTPGSAST